MEPVKNKTCFMVEDGCFRYARAAADVLRGVHFSVCAGDVLAVLGPNGAGKTTLLRCAMGLLPWLRGRSVLDGRDVRAYPGRKLWRRLAYVPQARSASAAYTVEEMVLLGRASHVGSFSLPAQVDLEKTEEAIARLGLESIRHKYCAEISGGELQMTLIARALASSPEVLVLDEPESNLDFRNQLIVLDTISSLAREGMACMFNTHYPAHALRRANKALLIGKNGRFMYGKTSDVVTVENIERFFGVRSVIVDADGACDVVPLSLMEATA